MPQKLTDIQTASLFKAFIMGPAGTGKTVFSCGLPGPIIVYDFDGKIESAYSYYKKTNPDLLTQVEFENCAMKDNKGSGFKLANDSLGKLADQYHKDKTLPYKTCVIDSSTYLSTEMLNWVVHENTQIPRNSKIKTRKIASMQDYQVLAPTFREFLFQILSLPWNVVVTGHVKVQQDELTGEILRSADVPGQMSTKIPSIFPEVYRTYVDNKGQYMAQTKADYKYACRSQIQGLPENIPLDFNAIQNYLWG